MIPGAYGEGLVVLAGAKELDIGFWGDCSSHELIAYTGMGDFFVRSHKDGVISFVDAQRAQNHAITADIDIFFDQFLVERKIAESVLQIDKFDKLRKSIGPLRQGCCYIPEPWPMLGGSGDLDTYVQGSFEVYVYLLSKSHWPE